MTDIEFPAIFKTYLRSPTLKAAFFSKLESNTPGDCKNCGGIGGIILFLATEGPYNYVPNGKVQATGRDERGNAVTIMVDIVAHWSEGKWWGGKNVEEMCPVCKGTGIDPKYVEQQPQVREIPQKDLIKPAGRERYAEVP